MQCAKLQRENTARRPVENPFNIKLTDFTQSSGITKSNKRGGTKSSKMHVSDYVDGVIGTFYSELRKNAIETKQPIPMLSISDTGKIFQFIIGTDKKNPLVKIDVSKDKKSITNISVRNEVFNFSTHQEFQYHAVEMAKSLNKWKAFIEKHSMDSLDMVNAKYNAVLEKAYNGKPFNSSDIELMSILSSNITNRILPSMMGYEGVDMV